MKPLCDCLLWITQEAARVPQSSAPQHHLLQRDGGRTALFGLGSCSDPVRRVGVSGVPPGRGYRQAGGQEEKRKKKETLKGFSVAAGVTAIVDSWMRPERRLQRLLLPRVLPEDSSPLSARKHKVKVNRRPLLNRMSPLSSSKGRKYVPASPHLKM